jgi:putative hydrolase of the HAD superfamily
MADGLVAAEGLDGILFDVDHTLVDTAGAFRAALSAVRVAFMREHGDDVEPAMLSMWEDDVNGHYRAFTRGELTFDEQRRRRADEMHSTLGGPRVDEDFYPEWLSVFWTAFEGHAWTAFPDVVPALSRLHDGGIRVGVVTNANSALQRHKLEAAGLMTLVDGTAARASNREIERDRVVEPVETTARGATGPNRVLEPVETTARGATGPNRVVEPVETTARGVVVGVDALGFGKPRPEIFLEGCRQLGTDPARTAYVGDEPTVDAIGAAKAGLIGIWVDRAENRRRLLASGEWPSVEIDVNAKTPGPSTINCTPRTRHITSFDELS